jgi:hypothetical protein
MGKEQLRDRAHPTSGVNRRVQLVNVGKKFCFGRSGEQFVVSVTRASRADNRPLST